MPKFGGFSNSSDEGETQFSQFSQKSSTQVKMVGKLENVKEKDQYAKGIILYRNLNKINSLESVLVWVLYFESLSDPVIPFLVKIS